MADPVKTTFSHLGQSYTTYWNGKSYNGTSYVTVNANRGGSQTKVTFNEKTGTVNVGGSSSLDFGRAALHSFNTGPFNKFDFSPRGGGGGGATAGAGGGSSSGGSGGGGGRSGSGR